MKTKELENKCKRLTKENNGWIKSYELLQIDNEMLDDKCATYEKQQIKNNMTALPHWLFVIMLTLSLTCIILFISYLYSIDNLDVDDVIAPMMCDKYGLEVHSIDTNMFAGNAYTEDSRLIITCKEHKEVEPIEDGYLLRVIE